MSTTWDLVGQIEAQARRMPEKLAYVRGTDELTYAALFSGATALAGWLARQQPADRSPVVIQGHKEPEVLVGFVGVLMAGRPYVPVDDVMPPSRLERIVELSRAGALLSAEQICAFPTDTGPVEQTRADLSSPAYIMFTSGSTGEPKGVIITHGNLAAFLSWMIAEQAPRPDDVFLNQVPYTFDVSVMDTYQALLAGATIFSVSREEIASPKRLFAALSSSGVTVWVSTPSFAQMCLAEPRFGRAMLPRVRKFLFCGETLPPDVVAQLLERFPGAEVWNTYGPTEATVAVTSIQTDRALLDLYSPLPIGRPMPGSQVVVLNDELRPVGPGERGEIVIAGPNVSPGYLHRPAQTARAFFSLHGTPAYRTGDWGHHQDGLIFCDGRMDGQVKVHGHRIEIGDVEANLRALRVVRDAIVAPIVTGDSSRTIEGLAACIVLSERTHESDFFMANVVRTQLAERVPSYMVPRRIRFLDTFPMTVNGKADRQAITRLFQ